MIPVAYFHYSRGYRRRIHLRAIIPECLLVIRHEAREHRIEEDYEDVNSRLVYKPFKFTLEFTNSNLCRYLAINELVRVSHSLS